MIKKLMRLTWWLGDLKALYKGRLLQRIWNKGIMKTVMKFARKVMK